MNDGRGVHLNCHNQENAPLTVAARLFLHRHPEQGFLYITDQDGLI
jgi:hypothetical protein